MNRRNFIAASTVAAAGAVLSSIPGITEAQNNKQNGGSLPKKKRVALIGTGSRGTSMWGKDVIKDYSDYVEYVGLCDINPGRLEAAKNYMGATCKTFTDFEIMMKEVKPDVLIVTVNDYLHDKYIIRGLDLGCDVISEKPMTTDEVKCQAILDAEKRSGNKLTVTFNYRYSPHRSKIWELIRNGEIGEITSVDFHWYLDTSHGADYFRRWHRKREYSGSLWLHKASHHFDLLNWWIDSEPEEVFALGNLEFYGKNGKQRGVNCRSCQHKDNCDFYWNVDANPYYKMLYTDNEKYDGYLRDGCVFKEDIDIFDKMTASIKYANGVQVAYSVVTYAPYEGYRIAFNGTKGRIDAWIQEKNPTYEADYDEIMITHNFGKRDYIRIAKGEGHGGGDKILHDHIFKSNQADPFKQAAGVRDGAFAILIGIAARKSCDSGKPIKIAELTDLVPRVKKI
ncbi:MAG: Gfo/Idh/MocA family oxidoreductase [Paludibacter sp.]